MHKTPASKELKIEIKGNIYTLKYPNTGQFIDIQTMKARITDENYGTLKASNDYGADYAKVLVDMIATYNILIPDLKKDLNVTAILGLSLIESRQLLDPYIETYLPWITEYLDIVMAVKPKDEPKKVA
jgi:hypothetical protein